MNKGTIPLLAIALLLIGCEPVPHYNRVQMASLTGQPNKVPIKQHGKVKPYGTVKLFQSRAEVTTPYEVIGIMTVAGEPGDEARFITAFLYRAADMGADAIILNPSGSTFVQKGGAFIAGPGGAFGTGSESRQDGVYRAEAIRLKPAT